MAVTAEWKISARGLRRLALKPAQRREINGFAGRRVAECVREHFRALNAERSGNSGLGRSGFYADASRNVSEAATEDGFSISISKRGLRLRLKGGDVTPGPGKKYLTIPNRPESYGRRAAEFAGQLRFTFVSDGNFMRPALVERGVSNPQAANAYYWLVKRTRHKPDPTVMPTKKAMSECARRGITAWFLVNDRGGEVVSASIGQIQEALNG